MPGSRKKKSKSILEKKTTTPTLPTSHPLSFITKLNDFFHLKHVNESKLLIGCIMIIMNVGAKFVDFNFSKNQEHALRNGLARELIVFAAVFMATRDLITALLLTAAFVVLADIFFHDESKYCLIPKYMQKVTQLIDLNKDGYVSPAEEKRAIEILERAERNKQNSVANNFVNYFNANAL
jgi:hypothetical protein